MKTRLRQCIAAVRAAVPAVCGRRLPAPAIAALLVTCGGSAPAAAAAGPDIQPLQTIRDTVRRHLETEFEDRAGEATIAVGRLDSRLRLPRCTQALEVMPRDDRLNTTHQRVGVRCNGLKPWSLYVPVTVKRKLPVVVLTAPLARGAPLTGSALAVELREVAGFNQDYYVDPAQLAGMAARRPLPAGSIVGRHDVDARRVIRRGQRVTLATRTAGIEVRAAGIAMSDGSRGDRIPVRNEKSDRVVYGSVRPDGTIAIN